MFFFFLREELWQLKCRLGGRELIQAFLFVSAESALLISPPGRWAQGSSLPLLLSNTGRSELFLYLLTYLLAYFLLTSSSGLKIDFFRKITAGALKQPYNKKRLMHRLSSVVRHR